MAAKQHVHVKVTKGKTRKYGAGTEDDPATTPTPSITVRRNAAINVERIA